MKATFHFAVALSLCVFLPSLLSAQQFKLTATNLSAYYFDNIYDLRKTGTAQTIPAGLVRFQANANNLFGTSVQHYNVANGQVINPNLFNYAIPANNVVRNLRGSKYTETPTSYHIAGKVEELVAGAIREHIFVLRVNSATGVVMSSRRLMMPTTLLRPEIANIIVIGESLVVSGTVLVNGGQVRVFAFRTDLNGNVINWFRVYHLTLTRDLSTNAQALILDGANLVLAGVDRKNNRAVVFKVNPANGNIATPTMSYSLCTPLSCRMINYASIGRSGNYANLVTQTTANTANNILFNVAQLNAQWNNTLAQTTYSTNSWRLRSVRFENQGVLLSHFDSNLVVANMRYTRGRFSGNTGALIGGTLFQYHPPTTDLTGVVRQMQTLTLNNNRTFSVGKYRNMPAATTRTLVELLPSSPNCQTAWSLQTAAETLRRIPDSVYVVPYTVPTTTLPAQQVNLPAQALLICPAAFAGDGVSGRSQEQESEEVNTSTSDETMLKVSPNPFDHQFTVNSREHAIAEMVLYDMTGRLLHRWNFNGTQNNVSVEVPDVVNGTYLLRVRAANGQWHTQKVVRSF